MAPTFDLQSHSTRSDGALEPSAVVAAAAAAGVALLALSDHDTVDGVAEALTAAATHDGLRVVPAAELSALDGELEDLHVLGYAFDHTSPALLDALAAFREDRNARAGRMAEALRADGLALADEPLDRRRAAGRPIGRPHLAQAVFEHPDNAGRLADEGLTDFSEVLVAYLVPGRPGYVRRTAPTVEEAIAAIHDAGGVAVWAHPFWDVEAPQDALAMLERFAGLGMDGVEAFYTTHSREQTLLLCDAAERLGLLTTGSADFHGPAHPHFREFRAFELHGREPVLGPIAEVA